MVTGNKAGATGVSNGTVQQFLFTANLTHTNVELELASVVGVWKGMGLEARETPEGLFSQRARVRVRIPFPSKFESVSFAAAQAMLPDPTREWALRDHGPSGCEED